MIPSRASSGREIQVTPWVVIVASLSLLSSSVPLATSRAGVTQSNPTPKPQVSEIELCERLEPVTEAVIDGRPALVPAAARRVQMWWKANRQAFPGGGDADSVMTAMLRSAQRGEANEAARAAVGLSIRALEWDGGARTTPARLMLIDVVGMAGWIRAGGGELEWPRQVPVAVDSLASVLERRNRPRAAARLQHAVGVVMEGTGDRTVRTAAALALLELVVGLERVLR